MLQTEVSPAECLSLAKFVHETNKDFILYKDDAIVVVNKPAGLLTTGASGASPLGVGEAVRALVDSDIHPVHQLDKDTSGVIILGRGRNNRGSLSKQFANRTVKKQYFALVDGDWNGCLTGIIAPLTPYAPVAVKMSQDSKKAITSFEPLAVLMASTGHFRSLLRVRIYTGRTHQIRAHLSYLGFPITGDRIYNCSNPSAASRQMLHATQISFAHPTTREQMTLHAPLAEDFRQFLGEMAVIKANNVYDQLIST